MNMRQVTAKRNWDTQTARIRGGRAPVDVESEGYNGKIAWAGSEDGEQPAVDKAAQNVTKKLSGGMFVMIGNKIYRAN